MKNEQELRAAIEAARSEYQSKYDTGTRKELDALSARVTTLQGELGAMLSVGAEKCTDCGTVFGMLKTPEVRDPEFGTIKSGAVYEVGCMCPSVTDPETGIKTIWGSQGGTPAAAVDAWNKNLFVRKREGPPKVVRPEPAAA